MKIYKSLLCFFSVCFFCSFAFSQKNISVLSKEDSLQTVSILQESSHYLSSDKTKAADLATKALSLCIHKNDFRLEAKSYAALTASQRYNVDKNILLNNDENAIEKAKAANDDMLLMKVTFEYARDLLNLSFIPQAATQMNQLAVLSRKTNTLQSQLLFAYAKGLQEIKVPVRMKQADSDFTVGLQLSLQVNDPYMVALNKLALFRSHFFMGQVDTTARLAFEALSYFEKNNYADNITSSKIQIGESYMFEGNLDKAKEYFNNAYPEALHNKNLLDVIKVLSDFYQIHILEEKWSAAKADVQSIEKLSYKLNYEGGVGMAKSFKARQLSKEGNYVKADSYFKEAKAIANKFNIQTLKTIILSLEAEHLNNQHKQREMDSVYMEGLAASQKTFSKELLTSFYKSKTDSLNNSADKKVWIQQKLLTDSVFRKEKGLQSLQLLKDSTLEGNMLGYRPMRSPFDSTITVEYNRQLLDFETQYKTRQKEDSLHIERQQVVIAKERIQNQNITIIAALLIALLLAVGFYLQYKNRRRAERDKEKIETLQKEIYHRVENNLAVLRQLVNVSGEGSNVSTDTLQSRISAIELLHTRLYQDNLIGNLSLQKYLTELTHAIADVYATEKDIHISTDAPVKISSRTAERLGLIVNEVVANSFKYAFDNRKQGSIRIEASAIDDKSNYRLTIADNGKGFSPKKNEGYGMKLINGLAQELNGRISYENNNGTLFILYFTDLN